MVTQTVHLLKLYTWYRSLYMRSVRVAVFVVLASWLLVALGSTATVKVPLFFFNCFIMFELFYRYKIARLQPEKTVSGTQEDDAVNTCTLPVLYALYIATSAEGLVHQLLSSEQARFVLEHTGITPEELPHNETEAISLLRYAHKITQQVHGTYITSADVLSAYLLLDEEKGKLLFSKKVKQQELLEILTWARMRYPHEEKPKKLEVTISGAGIGEGLTSGWTLETKKYTRDFSSTALAHSISIIGREQEYKMLQEALAKKNNNNILLIGEHGAGKEGLIQKFAVDSYSGKALEAVQHKKILEILVGPLIAGVNNRGELESRIQAIIEEVSHAGNIILYIPELQDILGSASFAMDISGALYPYLQDGNIPVIASLTPGNYKLYLEGKPLAQLFTPIQLNEPKEEQALHMLMDRVTAIEASFHMIITYPAIVAAVHYGDRYAQEMQLPGSAIRLLDDVASTPSLTAYYGKSKKLLVTKDSVIKKVEERTRVAIAEPSQEEKNLLLHLEEKLQERVIGQEQAIRVLAQALRRLRSGIVEQTKPISFLFLGPTGVGKTETAKTLAATYYGGEAAMIRLDMSEYSDESGERRLLGAPPGQGEERGELTEKVRDNPHSLILLDEFEKAHPRILDLFLQVLDDGRLTDNKGRTISFANCLIVATSNAGADYIREHVAAENAIEDKQFLNFLQSQHLFKPELLNRFDDIVVFKPLTQPEIKRIAQLLLNQVEKTMQQKDVAVSFDEKVLTKIATEGYDQQFGARPIRRYIQDTVEDMLSQRLLAGSLKRGDSMCMSVSQDGSFTLVPASAET